MVSYGSDAEEATSGRSSPGTTASQAVIEFTFEDGYQCRPWRNRTRGAAWVTEEILNAYAETKDGLCRKVWFESQPLTMSAQLVGLTHDALEEKVVPKLRTLLGPNCGKVCILDSKEVSEKLANDQQHRTCMEARESAVAGSLVGVKDLLKQAMDLQGGGALSQKKRNQMSLQVCESVYVCTQAAQSGMKIKKMKREAEEDEE